MQRRKNYLQNRINKLIDTIRENEILINNIQEKQSIDPENSIEHSILKKQIEQENQKLLRLFNRSNMERCRKSKFLKRLYGGKKDIVPVFGQIEWAQYDEAFLSVYPFFTSSLKKSFPHLSEQEVRICQLSVMGVKTSKVADVLLLQSDTVSSYKQKIKKACFPNTSGTLEELLLPFIVG